MKHNRTTTTFLTVILAILAGLSMSGLLMLDSWIMVTGVIIACMSLVLMRVPSLPYGGEALIRTAGYIFGGMAVYAFFSPTLGGMRETYLALPNIVMLLEISIVLLLHGNEGRETIGMRVLPVALYSDILRDRKVARKS